MKKIIVLIAIVALIIVISASCTPLRSKSVTAQKKWKKHKPTEYVGGPIHRYKDSNGLAQ